MNFDFKTNLQPNSESRAENEFYSKEQSSFDSKKEVIYVFSDFLSFCRKMLKLL